ncbi:MAG: S8/S53 family peptidase [Ferruginibacter sp.]
MKIYNQPVELIINMPPANLKSLASLNLKKQLSDAGVPVETILNKSVKMPAGKKSAARSFPAATKEKIYVRTKIKDSEMNPWDLAHLASKSVGAQMSFIEPDFLQEFAVNNNLSSGYKTRQSKGLAKSIARSTGDNGFDPDWKPQQNTIWHLGDDFSQLKSAREAVDGINYIVRVGHLDTGYDPTHTALPDAARINKLQRNFVEGEDPLDAHDPRKDGMLRMPGHGTGTLALLAGTKVNLITDDGLFNDYLGGAPFADVVCCRISPSVILFKTSAFAEALNYLTGLTNSGTPVHVVSMSMGGAPAKAWSEAVNAAYEAGIVLVTASGNNYSGIPTQHVIYPARFGRVIAACGVTNDLRPYHHNKPGEMEGCYGPERHMSKALSAFTPNTPWASGSASLIKFSGAGTSSATPQIAAAAAIYYKKFNGELDRLEPWQRVEAIRYALYKSASKTAKPIGTFKNSFGNGLLKANDALSIPVKIITRKTPADSMPWFPILTTIFRALPGEEPNNKMTMFNTELAQLVYYYPDLAVLIDNEKKPYNKVTKTQWKQFKDAVIQHPGASVTLKKYLMSAHP